MAKRMSQTVSEAAAKYAGKGVSDRLLDRAYWLETDALTETWIDAIACVDATGDKRALLKMLRETGSPRDWLIADLLERHQLRRMEAGSACPTTTCRRSRRE